MPSTLAFWGGSMRTMTPPTCTDFLGIAAPTVDELCDALGVKVIVFSQAKGSKALFLGTSSLY
jgi:hypothetical protein